MNSYNEVRQALDPYVGVPFHELADALGVGISPDPARRKAAGGHIVESLLEIARNSIPRADLERLGTEVKSIPLNARSRPRERTKVTMVNLEELRGEPDLYRSHLYAKLRSILFVPIQKTDNDSPDHWYLRPPFLWLPTDEQLVRIERDYAFVQGIVASGDWSRMPSGPGEYLTLSTAGARSAGMAPEEKSRAWYLKTALTREVCLQNLWPREALEDRGSGSEPLGLFP